jgi:hypothetical protein
VILAIEFDWRRLGQLYTRPRSATGTRGGPVQEDMLHFGIEIFTSDLYFKK